MTSCLQKIPEMIRTNIPGTIIRLYDTYFIPVQVRGMILVRTNTVSGLGSLNERCHQVRVYRGVLCHGHGRGAIVATSALTRRLPVLLVS